MPVVFLPMPAPLRILLPASLGLVLLAAATSAVAATPTVEDALKLEPRQKGIDFDRPRTEEIQGASIKQEKLDGVDALVVRRPDGRILRGFADTNGDRVVDRWSFFKDGVEVFREMATNTKETKANEARWLNAGGSRWGIDRDGDGVIDTWKTLSAEEATAEIIHALRDRDPAAFNRLLPTRDDLTAAGFSGERLADLMARVTTAREQFAKLATTQKKVGAKAAWASMLVPQAPGILPAGSPGVERDITAYDNVVVLAEDGTAGVQVVVGSLVRCGDAWRPLDAPQLAGDDGRLADMPAFFSPMLGASSTGPAMAGADEKIRPLLAKLAELDNAMASADEAGRRKLAVQHATLLEQVVAGTAGADQNFWKRQLVETVAAYVQEGLLPDGLAQLERFATEAGTDEDLAAFIAFRVIQARYAAGMDQPGANIEKLQETWFSDLTTFVEAHPRASEASEAMIQLAFRDEFSGRDEDAIARYKTITESFAETPNARKAAGAVRRLQSVGKPLDLKGRSIDGKDVSLSALKGGPVLIHYWSTDCEPCKVDLAQIRELQAKYGSRKFGCIGIALDTDRDRLVAFLRDKPLAWPQLHEEGGLDSRLAESFGIMVLPTMILLDADGKVVDRNVSITELERKLTALLDAK
jgi:thiol-disulfide isomerase/thioredoxin